MSMNDAELLREYAEQGSEKAFRELVERHTGLVYAVAQSRLENSHQAEEVTQAVFITLAQKAHRLRHETVLAGWLFRAARFAATNALRSERRHQHWTQEAARMAEPTGNAKTDEPFAQYVPELHEALACLGRDDHNALLLRFFEEKNLKEVAQVIGTSEAAAKKRVARALEKLRTILGKRGVVLPAAALTALLLTQRAPAAPAGLSASVASIALAKSAPATTSTITLVKGILKFMAWTKLKTALVVGAALILTGGTATVVLNEPHVWGGPDESVWRADRLAGMRPMVIVRPTKFARDYPSGFQFGDGDRFRILAQTLPNLIGAAYSFSVQRMAFETGVPPGRYDCLVTAPNSRAALQTELKRRFRLTGRRETREADVLLLKVKSGSGSPGLHPAGHPDGGSGAVAHLVTGMRLFSAPMSTLAANLEDILQQPVVDQTGMEGQFDMVLDWQKQGELRDWVNTALVDELGLELVPSHESLEMLVVRKSD
jgi:uncharacterized protein (TIGR03435 family)